MCVHQRAATTADGVVDMDLLARAETPALTIAGDSW